MCETAGISRSGYYSWLTREQYRVQKEYQDKQDFELILKAFQYKNRYKGAKSIKMVLFRKFHVDMNLKKIRRLMNKYGLRCPIRKANPYKKIGKAIKSHSVANKVNREFCVGKPGKVLLTDITYIYYGSGKCAYLSTVKDGCTHQIPSYVLSESLELPIVTNTIHVLMANKAYIISKDAYLHSDQGIHYTSTKFQKLIKSKGLIQSMSRKGNCWDNAPQESFFGHMKDELNLSQCETFDRLKSEIDEYMKYYNNERYQWGLMKMSPNEYYEYLTTGIMPY
jgi:transposase InsO family protein